MRLNAKKRKIEGRAASQDTTLRIMSNVAIIEGRPDRYNRDSVGIQQQKMFLNCKVNIEMKRWGLLANRKNKSPMTQVAAESMVRRVKQENNTDDWLFSLLTDCMALYCVRHEVASKEYWISRSVNTPEEILVSICWLYLKSLGIAQIGIMGWETCEWSDDEAGGDEAIEGGEKSSMLESLDESNEASGRDDEHDREAGTEAANQAYEMTIPLLSFENNEEEEEEEEQRKKWQTFFLMENHRKYGTPLPLTEALVSLHNTQA